MRLKRRSNGEPLPYPRVVERFDRTWVWINYDPDTIDMIKAIPGRVWHARSKAWSIPREHTDRLLGVLRLGYTMAEMIHEDGRAEVLHWVDESAPDESAPSAKEDNVTMPETTIQQVLALPEGGPDWYYQGVIDAVRMGKPIMRDVIVTPEDAAWILEHAMAPNRNERFRPVYQYGRMMAENNWKLSGSVLSFNRAGQCSDGQHRMKGSVHANAAFPTWVQFGVPNEDFAYLDQGAIRGVHEMWGIALAGEGKEEKYAAAWAATVNKLARWSVGIYPRQTMLTRTELLQFGLKVDNQTGDMLRLAQERAAVARHNYPAIVPSVWGMTCFLLSVYDEVSGTEKGEEFIDKLSTGVGLMSKTDPIVTARRTINNAREQLKSGQTSPEWVMAIVIKTWTKWMEGTPSQIMSYRKSEQFPKLYGEDLIRQYLGWELE